jgi:hypothetical protein
MTMTKMTAMPIPMEVLMLLLIPKKAQSAMNRMSRMLFTIIALRRIRKMFRSFDIIARGLCAYGL